MPPMARTSRSGAPSANVDALDNIDLDDMFEDGGDAFFDGLDIDLGNMDDITGGNNASFSGPQASQEPELAVPPPEEPPPGRRKTKRKTKSRFPYDEDETYGEPAKKKTKSTKSTAKKRSSKKATAQTDDASKTQVSGAKGKVKGRGSVTVAAAGQFGGRNKRGGSFVKKKLPTSRTADGKAKSTAGSSAAEPASSAAADLSQILSTHPGLTQSPFCGLLPSNTLFYPFMPTLPSEPTLKSKKTFSLIDRIHSSFLSHLTGSRGAPSNVDLVESTDAAFKLLEEAYRDPPSTAAGSITQRTETIGSAIGALRRTISLFEKPQIAGDLYAICALLKRQHDFLKQNMDNMEKWCRKHLPNEEYAAVYLPPRTKKRKSSETGSSMSVLRSFGRAEIKVRIACAGFKEPKGRLLLGILPSYFLPTSTDARGSSRSKKRKIGPDTSRTATSGSVSKSKVLTYSECKPVKRRAYITSLIARTARELEYEYSQQMDERRLVVTRQEADLRRLAAEDELPIIHTNGMWRWLDKSSLFGSLTEKDVRNRLGVVRHRVYLRESEEVETWAEGLLADRDGSMIDRLTSLLVEEDDLSETEGETDEVLEAIHYEEDDDADESLLDLSPLTVDERVVLHLQAVGLVEPQFLITREVASSLPTRQDIPPTESKSILDTRLLSDPTVDTYGRESKDQGKPTFVEQDSDVEEILRQMQFDLDKVTMQNNDRANFLESLALSSDLSANDQRRKRDAEAALVAKCHQLLKKSRESKAKSGKAKSSKNDDSALPW